MLKRLADQFLVSIAKFALQHLTIADESGFMDADLELCEIYKYLASRYNEAREQKKDILRVH
jgi:hypothetical protein